MFSKIAVIVFAGLTLAQPAAAATAVYSLTAADNSSGLGAGPFGTVTVTENAGSLTFVQTLVAGYRIHDGNANHSAFAFNIVGDPAITVSNLTSGFTAISTTSGSTVASQPFGSFSTAIDCSSACGNGYQGGYTGSLSFTVSAATPLTLASLRPNTVNGNQYFFTTDVVNANGLTGNVGATASSVTAAVPEPATWAMMIAGFGLAITYLTNPA